MLDFLSVKDSWAWMVWGERAGERSYFFYCPSSAHRFDTSMLELLVPQKGEVFGGDGHIQPGGASDRGSVGTPP